jgi:hypothetical protein
MDKVSRPDMKQSDLKNQLADNIVNIAKEYVDDDEKYFPIGKNTSLSKQRSEQKF